MDRKKTLHAKMVNEISHHIDRQLENGRPWKAFLARLGFTPVEHANCNDIFDVFSKLETKGKIEIGKYSLVRKSLKSNYTVCTIIDKYVKKMKDTATESDDDDSTEDINKDNGSDDSDDSESGADNDNKRKQRQTNLKVTQEASNININISGNRVGVRDVGKQEVNNKTGKRRTSSKDRGPNKKKRKA